MDTISDLYNLGDGTTLTDGTNYKDYIEDLSDSSSGTSATERLAEISRLEWEDYQERFVPLEDKLISSKLNWDSKDSIAEALNTSMQASLAGAGITGRNQSRYGLQNAADVDMAIKSQHQQSAALSAIDAANTTRDSLEEYRMTY